MRNAAGENGVHGEVKLALRRPDHQSCECIRSILWYWYQIREMRTTGGTWWLQSRWSRREVKTGVCHVLHRQEYLLRTRAVTPFFSVVHLSSTLYEITLTSAAVTQGTTRVLIRHAPLGRDVSLSSSGKPMSFSLSKKKNTSKRFLRLSAKPSEPSLSNASFPIRAIKIVNCSGTHYSSESSSFDEE